MKGFLRCMYSHLGGILISIINKIMNELLWYRRNKIIKHVSIGTHGDLKGKEFVIGSAIWLLGNCMQLSAIKEYSK